MIVRNDDLSIDGKENEIYEISIYSKTWNSWKVFELSKFIII